MGATKTVGGLLDAFEIAQPGDVIVAATEAFKGSAVVGDLFACHGASDQVRYLS
jgi:regulator of RNase E activity RraA